MTEETHPYAEESRLAEEILGQAEILLALRLDDGARERIISVRRLARSLLEALRMRTYGHKGTVVAHGNEIDPALPSGIEEESATYSILLVEDNLLTQKLMTRLLELRGHRVQTANNGRLALEALASDSFDLVLMDLRMPEMDGWDTTTAIRKQELEQGCGRLPIIAVTSLVGESERRRIEQVGMDGFHGKPVRAEELFAEIHRVMEQRCSAEPTPVEQPAECLEEVVIDLSNILVSVDNDLSLLTEVMEIFFNDTPRLMVLIREGIETGNAHLVRESAHSLKGASGAFGKHLVYELSLALEQLGRQEDLTGAENLFGRLHAALTCLELNLRKAIKEHERGL